MFENYYLAFADQHNFFTLTAAYLKPVKDIKNSWNSFYYLTEDVFTSRTNMEYHSFEEFWVEYLKSIRPFLQ